MAEQQLYPRKLLDRRLGLRRTLLGLYPKQPESAFPLDAKLTTRKAAAWQRQARKCLQHALGDPPQRPRNRIRPHPRNRPKARPRVRVLERVTLDGYRRTMFVLDTLPGIGALCWYCVPDGATRREPRPALIATPGHGIGARDLLAMDAQGKPRPEGAGYQKDYALQTVRLGLPTLVVEPLGFGERRDPDRKPQESPCHTASALAMMLGTTLAGIRCHELRCALDWLEQQPEVRADSIGLMGISGGGQMTLWTAALEQRFKVAIVSGYFNRFADSILGVHHCICNHVPGLGRQFDMPDLAAMIAPRPMLIQSGTEDPIFPVKASRSAFRQLQRIYDVWDARSNLVHDVFEGDHQWSTRSVEPFLTRFLCDGRHDGC